MEAEVVKALSSITDVLRALQVTTRDGERTADTYVPFNDVITGTTPITVWDPPPGYKWRMKGALVVATVVEVLVSSEPGVLYFAESSSGDLVAPVCPVAEDAAEGVSLTGTSPVALDLREGRLASATTESLVLRCNLDVGTGDIRCAGVVWGVEVTD